MTEELNDLTVVSLQARNVMRLRAVMIEPESGEPIVRIMGPNGAGKTSVLDCIWMALGGKSAVPRQPLRQGATKGHVSLDLGKLRITRGFTAKGGTSLDVRLPDDSEVSSPQTVLDTLVGELTLDPLEFTRRNSKQQRETLLRVAGLTDRLAELDTEDARLREDRTEVGRKRKTAKGELDALDDAPDEVPELEDLDVLLQRQDGLRAKVAERNAADQVVSDAERAAAQAAQTIKDRQAVIDDLHRKLESAKETLRMAEEEGEEAVVAVTAARNRRKELGETDLDEIAEAERAVTEWRDKDEERRRAEQKAAAKSSHEEHDARYNALTAEIEKVDDAKLKAVEEADLPVSGLGVSEDGVTYRGVPFEQASQAEKLRVSLALAMAANPKVKILRVTDGSLLDPDSFAIVEELAGKGGYQVWLEQVLPRGADAPAAAVVIEDGAVREEDEQTDDES